MKTTTEKTTSLFPFTLADSDGATKLDLGEELIGRKLGHYEIVSELGKGAAGRVYLAWNQHLHRHCALKILSPNAHFTKAQLVEQFRNEGQATAGLVHQHIVTTHFLGQLDGHHFLEMEFLPGGSLAQFIKDRDRVSPVKALYWCNQISKGLGYAHSRNILHRDLKPSNVFLTTDQHIKVGDFGLACRIEEPKIQQGYMVGTPGYLAPELFLGEPATPASDVYALGITLYTLLAGQRPFEGQTLNELMLQHQSAPLPGIQQFCPDLPMEIATCLNRLTAENPHERPANGMAAALLIESVLGKTRDLEMLVQEAFAYQHQIKWLPIQDGYEIMVHLASGRSQKVHIIAKDTLHHQAVVQIFSVCCLDDPDYYQTALRHNAILSHGGIGLHDIDGKSHFILQNTYPRGTVDPEEIRESTLEIAYHADQIEKILTNQDLN